MTAPTAGSPAAGTGFEGRRVVVTGGTRGIGRAIALAFARAGARLTVVHRADGEAVRRLGEELTATGCEHVLVRADVTSGAGARLVADTVRDRFGGVDVLVNNVGVDGHAKFDDLAEEEWHRVMNHNATSTYLVTQALVGLLPDGASVVNVGASVALRGRPLGVHYSASKAALVGFTRALAKELGGRGIRVNTVAPGVTETEPGAGLPPAIAERLAGMTALGRLGRPEDVAGAVIYLAGDAAAYVTGVTLEVDGGI
ncbi:SDR family NAD(P)-dependent oxidoreductase [Streptomyces capitiformicae]|jgi:3-oxoacyl-[acyl-carrier protein] reductase|uniref:Short-chain dehydrogenase n=1 Tax=Streptomyces capitiformicae TaxID=2014920 RepID=A0A918ZJV7_9ACTN|nr:SDR family oxidoreductase [Streptomyces capitiformicae]GHE55441.1 short-chain dehydrogenase [Streptomyces capitiformicae]